ncbi:hypothetical protein BSAE_1116 [Bifidobacterium pullorum subsp. saeculare DSM 6531 = LMG 14934]|uniref:Uncharacterized protein n=1 Tax=Bifidobacterium pullorum subsp. saeculare DSM 6531 = LMG 14934 TaxID=1437611 RepID=A0A087CUA2_9BIFI|nr:hypothetical protein [Bifidobacterium pullorum]KFI86852.1 hypothetical protein BSAE_1116 [Bifidobacterium pullorum subsp. saeculare DSM 6531 = LMG 14934]
MDEHIQTSQHMLDTLSSDHARLMERTRMPRFYAVGIGILAGVLDVMWWVIGTAFAGGSLFGLHTTAMLIIALIINTVCLLGVIASSFRSDASAAWDPGPSIARGTLHGPHANGFCAASHSPSCCLPSCSAAPPCVCFWVAG